MSQINPLAGSILQSTQFQREQSAQKVQQAQRAQQLKKNIAAEDDRMEHQVESAEELRPAHEDGGQGGQGQRKNPRKSAGDAQADEPRLDVTA